ncbi:hypothetical protein FRC00_011429 [Tulasnella sp. 408]|nr:hypothetical protein FRC00_011429 [Tulasnella sp. 408]
MLSQPNIEIGNIEERGWRQFLLLSNKIKSLDIDCMIGEISLERIKLARQSFNGEPFGQLQAVKAQIWNGNHLTIDFLTVPSLRNVYLSCGSMMEMDSMCWLIDRMPVTAPQITSLGLDFRAVVPGMIEFSRYSALRHLSVDGYSIMPRLWESLTSCKLLKTFELYRCSEVGNRAEGVTWTVDFVDFPALRALIQSGNPTVTPALILRSRMPMLKYLWWETGTWAEGHDVHVQRVAAHLKLYSPKFDTDMLSRIKDTDNPSPDLNDDDLW